MVATEPRQRCESHRPGACTSSKAACTRGLARVSGDGAGGGGLHLPGMLEGGGGGVVLPPAGPGCSGLGFLLGEPRSGAGRGCVISWLKSRLLAVTLPASLGAGHAGSRGRGRGASGRTRACSQRLAAPRGLALYPRLPLGLGWPGLGHPCTRLRWPGRLGPLAGLGQDCLRAGGI